MYDPDHLDDGHLGRHMDRQARIFWRVCVSTIVAAWIGAALWVFL